MRELKDEKLNIWKLLKGFADNFKAQEAHINRCANLIKTIKTWDSTSKNEKHQYVHDKNFLSQDPILSKNLFKRIIRVSGESADYRATVDFVSIQALDIINSNSIARKKNLKAKHSNKDFSKNDLETGIRHEHMYPCEAAYHKLKDTPDEMIESRLKTEISFRALICSTKEAAELDKKKLKARLPVGLSHDCPAPALSRYCKIGLDKDLIPVSQRGRTLFEKKYIKYPGPGHEDGDRNKSQDTIYSKCVACKVNKP